MASSCNNAHPASAPADGQPGERPDQQPGQADQAADQVEPTSGEELEAAARAATKKGAARFFAGLALMPLGTCGLAVQPVDSPAGVVCLLSFSVGLALATSGYSAACQAPADLLRTAYWVGVREGRAQVGAARVPAAAGEPSGRQEPPAAEPAPAPASATASASDSEPEWTHAPDSAWVSPGALPDEMGEADFDGGESLERLLAHTDDTFGTLRSLIESPEGAGEYRDLYQLLQGVGLDEWTDAPKVSCNRLSSNRCFWIAADVEKLNNQEYDRLLAVEAALNLAWQVYEANVDTAGKPDYRLGARREFENAWRLLPGLRHERLVGSLQAIYEDPEAALAHSEWGLRFAVADTAEYSALPFRLVFDQNSNAELGVVLIRLEIPRPHCFSAVAEAPEERIELAKSYALRTAILMAAGAFRVPAAQRVVVSCHEHNSLRMVLSLQAEREDLIRLQGAAAAQSGWFDDPSLRVNFADDGWFGPVEPHLRASSPELESDRYFALPELDDTPCTPELQKVAHVRTAADFGINEDAERRQVWDRFTENLPTSAEAAVTRLMELRDSAGQAPTADACDQAIRALVEGSLELSDLPKLRDLFLAGTELDRAVEFARKAAETKEPQDLEPAIQRLEAALSPGMQILYLDDTDTVYRYFNNAAERVAFNRTAPDDRRVCLVPDIYYRAVSMAARLLVLAKRYDDAAVYVDEMMRIAPVAVDPVLFKARVLESKEDSFGAAALIRKILPQALSPRDLSLCLYRLAFFEWKLGHMELTIACYKAVVDLRVPLSTQAMMEAAQVIAADDELDNLTDQQVAAILEAEGIPSQVSRENLEWLLECAIRATDQHLYPVALSLTGTLVESLHDDVLIDLYRSLLPVRQL